MESKFCTNCGNPLKEGAAFCVSCGTAINRPQPEISEPQQPTEQPIEQPVPAPEQPVEQPAPQPAPVPEQPAPEPVKPAPKAKTKAEKKAEKKAAKKAAKKKKASKAAMPICFALFALVCSLNVFLGMRQATTPKMGTQLAMTVFQNLDLTEMRASNLVADDDYEGSVADWIVERANEEGNGNQEFEKEDFEAYLAESGMIKKLTERTGSLVANIRADAEVEELTTDDLRKMLEDDRATVKKHLHFSLNENDINKIVSELEKSKVMELTNPGMLREQAPGLYYAIQYGLSDWVLIGLVALIALCALALFLATRRKLRSFLGRLGITMAIAGGVSIGGSVLLTNLGDWLFDSLGSLGFLGSMVSGAANNFLVPGIGMVALGVAMLCIRVFVKKENA